MPTFAARVNAFNRSLNFKLKLPEGIRHMNPFKEYAHVPAIAEAFYNKYYSDNNNRSFIIGINPGRFGAGLTGVPFTDPKRLEEVCGISYPGDKAHEPSSVFIYEMIAACGGAEKFYAKYYINSICPLGFTADRPNGKVVNYNYYDSRELRDCVQQFVVKSMKQQIALGIETERCFCLGTGENLKYLTALNKEHGFFGEIIALEHPRYIMQYKSKTKSSYIKKYKTALM